METLNKIRFYADCPDGTKNKLFNFKDIKDLKHGQDILVKYLRKGYIIRASFYEFLDIFGNIQNVRINVNDIDLVTYKLYGED
jgi:hypothetical protein